MADLAPGRADPELLYLAGISAASEGDHVAAERALRGALYLDGGFAMAHYLLAQSLAAQGRDGEARRSLANAVAALADLDPEAPVREGDGRTAADLGEAARHRLAALSAA